MPDSGGQLPVSKGNESTSYQSVGGLAAEDAKLGLFGPGGLGVGLARCRDKRLRFCFQAETGRMYSLLVPNLFVDLL